MIELSTSQMGVDKIDMLTLEIPPFITESQLAMALYHIKVNGIAVVIDYFSSLRFLLVV